MSILQTSPVTGSAQTNLVTPTYTTTPDTAPGGTIGEQVAVTGLGGTQAGVTAHSVASPFTTNFTRPSNFRSLGKPNPVTGLIAQVPVNIYKIITRKGVLPLAGQPYAVASMITECSIPAGSDTADPANLRAMASMHIGSLTQQSSGLGDLFVNGVL